MYVLARALPMHNCSLFEKSLGNNFLNPTIGILEGTISAITTNRWNRPKEDEVLTPDD